MFKVLTSAAVVVTTAKVFPTKHEQALESFFGLLEQYDAKSGKSVVAAIAVVYVRQKVAAADEDTLIMDAQASFATLSQASTNGKRELKRTNERMMMKLKVS